MIAKAINIKLKQFLIYSKYLSYKLIIFLKYLLHLYYNSLEINS